jgi:putative membrane fusion protein
MNKGLVIGNRRIRFRFFIFLILCIVGCYYISRIFNRSYSYGIVEYGELSLNDKGDALVIRQEEVYNAPEYGKVNFLLAEGESVEKEQPIAIVYKANFKEELVYQLYSVREKILSYQQENILQDLIDKDIEKIDKDISNTILSIQTSIRDNQLESLDRSEKKLRSLFDNRQRIYDKKMAPDSYLEKLYAQEAELNKQLEEWRIEIAAPGPGLVSFSLDGMEDILSIKSLNYLTLQDFQNFIGQDIMDADEDATREDKPFFRIINPDKWYMACLIDKPSIIYEDDQIVEVSLIEPHSLTLEGKVYRIQKEQERCLIILEFSEKVEDIINIRSTKAEINKKFQGFMVPARAIKTRRGKKGVIAVKGDSKTFIEVNVIASDEHNAIIEKEGESEGLELHTKVLIERR